MKLRKINQKNWYDIYITCIKLTHRKFLLATTVFQNLCVCLYQILDRLDTKKICFKQLNELLATDT